MINLPLFHPIVKKKYRFFEKILNFKRNAIYCDIPFFPVFYSLVISNMKISAFPKLVGTSPSEDSVDVKTSSPP